MSHGAFGIGQGLCDTWPRMRVGKSWFSNGVSSDSFSNTTIEVRTDPNCGPTRHLSSCTSINRGRDHTARRRFPEESRDGAVGSQSLPTVDRAHRGRTEGHISIALAYGPRTRTAFLNYELTEGDDGHHCELEDCTTDGGAGIRRLHDHAVTGLPDARPRDIVRTRSDSGGGTLLAGIA